MKMQNRIAATSFAAAAAVGLALAISPTAAAADLVGPGCADYAAATPTVPLLSTGCRRSRSQSRPRITRADHPDLGALGPTQPASESGRHPQQWSVHGFRTDRRGLQQAARVHDRPAQDQRADAEKHPDLPRCARPASPAKVDGTRYPAGRDGHGDRQGNALKVNNAGVVCGGVPTANATVYMIDTVLMPPS